MHWSGRCSEGLVRIELGQRQLRRKLITPGLLHGRPVHRPQLLAQRLQALEDRQRLLGRPVRRQRCRFVVAWGHGLPLPLLTERCRARAASRSCASLAR